MDEIWKNVGAVVAGLTAIFQLGKKLYEYQEQHYVRRKLNRYSYLLKGCPKGSKEAEFIKILKRDETLKLTTGIDSTYEKYEMIMQVYALNAFTMSQIRRMQSYFVSVGNKAKGQFGLLELLSILWSSLMIFFLTVFYIYIVSAVSSKNDLSSLWVYIISTVSYLFLMFWVGEPIRNAFLYRKFRNKLIENKMWIQEGSKTDGA